MSIEIRNPAADELRAAMGAAMVAFGDEQKDEDFERSRALMPLERFLCAYEDGVPAGAAGAYPLRLTIPGGEVAAAGVTWVGVKPSHRRRGILTGFMQRLLTDARERDEAVAILWASEAAIYGRFGYGVATHNVSLDSRTDRFALRDDPAPVGRVRLVDAAEALGLLPDAYDRVRAETPGMFARSRDWWERHKLADPEHWRDGASPKNVALHEVDGRVEGWAIYRVKSEWEHGIPSGVVRVVEAIGASPVGTREIWRYLHTIDLMARVDAETTDPGSLFLSVVDPRRLGLRYSDGIWLRFVDVEAALSARSYEEGEPVVLELHDDTAAWNAGRVRVGRDVERTDAAADLELTTRDLASTYLGGFTFADLARAGRVRELRDGAVARADALFRTARPPYCPEEF